MENYRIIKQLGDGSFGVVYLAEHIHGGEKVAVKKMKQKYHSFQECLNLREVKSLMKLNNHPHIIKLREVVRDPVSEELYFVFEYMDNGNLYQMMRERDNQPFPEGTVKRYAFQLLQGLAYMHKHGFFHRDMKPENLLMMNSEVLKIADFGLAREIRSLPPFTDYVSTRWYRAPEVLLQSTSYSSPIDIWAVGAIISELITLKPLFPGSSEIDQIYKVCSVCGTPTAAAQTTSRSEGLKLAAAMNFKFPVCQPTPFTNIFSPTVSSEALQLMADMLRYDPHMRPTASEALRYPWF
ncbi:kinase-like domain-containing protein, partial [Cladochytrium replicatum]